jgi:transposase-like protein
MKHRRTFTTEFKLAAVKRCDTEAIGAVAKDLGIVRSLLDRWRSQVANGQLTPAVTSQAPVVATPTLAMATVKRSKPTPDSVRQEAIQRIENGEKPKAVAEFLGIKASRIYSWMWTHKKIAAKSVRLATTPLPQPQNILNFCPHCGMPLAAVNRALNAIAAINPR